MLFIAEFLFTCVLVFNIYISVIFYTMFHKKDPYLFFFVIHSIDDQFLQNFTSCS